MKVHILHKSVVLNQEGREHVADEAVRGSTIWLAGADLLIATKRKYLMRNQTSGGSH